METASLFKKIKKVELVATGKGPYEALLSAIAHQMVHARAAEAVLGRLYTSATGKQTKKVPQAEKVVALGVTGIKSAGFSQNKALAVFELAQKEVSGELPSKRRLSKMTDEEIIKTLVPLRGIGQWTVEMYLIFALGRPNVFPVDDFGVREGFRLWQGEDKQRTPKELKEIAKAWEGKKTKVALALWQVADMNKKVK